MKKNILTENQKERIELLNEIYRRKSLFPRAYNSWRKELKIRVSKNGLLNTKAKIAFVSLVTEILLLPIGLLVAFIFAEVKQNEYVIEYRKITKRNPKGYLIPEIILIASCILGIFATSEYTNGSKVQRALNSKIQELDDLSPDIPGIYLDFSRPINEILGLDINSKTNRVIKEKYSSYPSTPTSIVTSIIEPEITTIYIEYDNIVSPDYEVTPSYGIGGEMREIKQ